MTPMLGIMASGISGNLYPTQVDFLVVAGGGGGGGQLAYDDSGNGAGGAGGKAAPRKSSRDRRPRGEGRGGERE